MPYTVEHKQETRERIVESARRLFNRQGFTQVSIDEIMEGAGLTRGGFYNHFKNKEELYAEAVTHILSNHPAKNWDDVSFDFSVSGPALAETVVNAYLSRNHIEDLDGLCPMIALPSDIARGGVEVKRAYEQILEAMVNIFSGNFSTPVSNKRERALGVAALCVGGMVLARAVENNALSDEIREAARQLALVSGGWQNGAARKPTRN